MANQIKGKIKWVRSTDLLIGLALFFISLLFFIDLFGGRFLLTERDLGPYFIPPRHFWVESVKQGDLPLWNPYQFCGHPFFANPQHAILYPFNGIFFLLPFDIAINALIILHFFLGGLFTYLFVKDIKPNPSGALISGLIFMLSGYLLSVHSLLTILLSSVWTPLILMFFRRAIHKRGLKNEMFTAIFITLSFLGGGIEIVYGNFFLLLCMAFFTFKSLSPQPFTPFKNPPLPPFSKGGMKEGLSSILTRLRSLAIVSLLFLFLSAIQLFPFLELFHHSIRGGGISYQEATLWSFAPQDILLFFLPDAYGYFLDVKKYWVSQCWLKTLYTGGLPFILSLIFFLFRRKAKKPLPGDTHQVAPSDCHQAGKDHHFFRTYLGENDRGLYLSLMFVSLFLSLGNYNPLYPFVFKYIPFFNGIRYPVKFLYIFILALSITAGLGFDRLSELSKERLNQRYKNLFILLSLLCGSFLFFLVLGQEGIEDFLKLRGFDYPPYNHLPVNLFHAKRFLFYLSLFFLMIRVGLEVKWKTWTKMLLIFFLTADLFGNMGFYGKEKAIDYFQKTKILEKISSDQDFFRVFSTAKTISQDTEVLIGDPSPLNLLKEKHLPSMNLIYRLHDIWGIDVIRLRRPDDLYKAFTGAPSISFNNLIELYGIKYIVSVTPLEGDPRVELIYARLEGLSGGKEELLKENTIKLYKNNVRLPRAWLVKDYKVLDSKEVLLRMLRKDFDPRKEVLLEENPLSLPSISSAWTTVVPAHPGLPLKGGGKSEGEVEMISESNNRLKLFVNTREDNLLVLSDTFYPGWKAFIDGIPKKIYRANYAFRAIPLRPGAHYVEFVYTSLSFKLGALFTSLGIIVCVIVTAITRRR